MPDLKLGLAFLQYRPHTVLYFFRALERVDIREAEISKLLSCIAEVLVGSLIEFNYLSAGIYNHDTVWGLFEYGTKAQFCFKELFGVPFAPGLEVYAQFDCFLCSYKKWDRQMSMRINAVDTWGTRKNSSHRIARFYSDTSSTPAHWAQAI